MNFNVIGWLRSLLNLEAYKSREDEVVTSIRANVEFKGGNLWVLIFAIMIASIGLNVNSAAVIIGAMLISPLMGPIIGLGLGVGIYDFALIKKSAINLGIAALISITTAAIYFLLTPLKFAHSELLARTTPTTWDVLIAFFGGLAGIIATSSKEKGNVIPGVSIATALMPPLCTAGYGLATGQFTFFFGATYLFFINSVFICFATILIVRYLKFTKYQFVDEQLAKRVKNSTTLIVMITLIPSVYIAYNLVLKSIFENRAEQFITEEMLFDATAVGQKKIDYAGKRIEVLLVGSGVDSSELAHIQRKMPKYRLGEVELVIKQGRTDFKQENPTLNIALVQSLLREKEEEVVQKDSLIDLMAGQLQKMQNSAYPTSDILREIQAQGYPATSMAIGNVNLFQIDSVQNDSLCVALVKLPRHLQRKEQNRLEEWLQVRTHSNKLRVYYDIEP